MGVDDAATPADPGESEIEDEFEEIVDFEDPYALDGIEDPDNDEPVTAIARWRKTSTTGMILTGIGLGLQQVFGPPKDEIAIVSQAPSQPEDDDVILHFDPDSPENTWMEIRRPPER